MHTMARTATAQSSETAARFLSFVNSSPTPFHAVYNASLRLEKAGFQKIKEKDNWEKQLKPGDKYYYTREQSSLLAFTIPQNWKELQGTGVSIVATHVDSPNLRIRPISKRSKAGYLQVGVETYGGGLWHTWFDRDLSIAGRVVIGDTSDTFSSKLVHVKRPILRIPSLAIHLDRNVNDAFKFNNETETIPILGHITSELNKPSISTHPVSQQTTSTGASEMRHHPALISLLAEELSVRPEHVHDFELSLYDTQPACFGGINNEFLFSPRLDNLFSSFAAVEALSDLAASPSFSSLDGNVNCIALFNHEEVGSVSSTGAESSLIPSLLHRLSPTPSALGQSIAQSFLISADMTHAIHPNYINKHEENHTPVMNGGITVKTNAKQKYTSDAIGSFFVKKLVEQSGGRVQEYEVRNDMPCGSTVGPMLSKIGVRTVDVGCPILSMHSIREMAGSQDVQHAINLFSALFSSFSELEAKLTLD